MAIPAEQNYSAQTTPLTTGSKGDESAKKTSSQGEETAYAKVTFSWHQMGQFFADVQNSQENLQEAIAGKIQGQQEQQKTLNENAKAKAEELDGTKDAKKMGPLAFVLAVVVVVVVVAVIIGTAGTAAAAIMPVIAVVATGTGILAGILGKPDGLEGLKQGKNGSFISTVQVDLDSDDIAGITTDIGIINNDIGLIASDKQMATQDLTNSQNTQQTFAKMFDNMIKSMQAQSKRQ